MVIWRLVGGRSENDAPGGPGPRYNAVIGRRYPAMFFSANRFHHILANDVHG
jgi:hypothetical protein